MSRYNHIDFLKRDPLGEINFVFGKVRRMAYERICTAIAKIMLKSGGVK